MDEKVKLALEDALLFKFPNIENLKIKNSKEYGLNITFNEGKYSKKEVEDFLKSLRKEIIKPIMIEELRKTNFGYTFKKPK